VRSKSQARFLGEGDDSNAIPLPGSYMQGSSSKGYPMHNAIRKFNTLANIICIIFGIIIVITLVKWRYFGEPRPATDKVQKERKIDQATSVKGIDTITIEQIELAKKNGQRVTILDVRGRRAYSRNGIVGAKNIPADELYTRALNELSPSDMIVPYCRCSDDRSLSVIARQILNEQGYHKVSILKEGIGN
jgi:rhodanese-related sulfurtransferase